MKAPDHPTPSGDRQMARALITALERAGHRVDVASRLRSFVSAPAEQRLAALEAKAALEGERLVDRWASAADAPDLWFSYHPYYKAPDLIGPAVSKRLVIPYVSAEASHAAKRNQQDWRPWQIKVEDGLRQARLNVCFNARDRDGLASFLGRSATLVDLPPFIDTFGFAARRMVRPPRAGGRVELIAVAMMRPGVKVQSYRFLAHTLAPLRDIPWRLTIIGDGPERGAVEDAFASFDDDQLNWLGAVEAAGVRQALQAADLYLWPGFGEAYGIAYLEAQASGLPVVALDSGGTSSVVKHGATGLLVAEYDADAYTAAIRSLVTDGALRDRLGQNAHAFVHTERTLDEAAQRLDGHLRAVVRVGASGRPS